VGDFTLPVNSVYEGVVTSVDCAAMTATQCDAVKATTWTGVDSISTKTDCNADSFSNTIDATGKYGCNFGLITAGTFGRFVPDHFNTVTSGGMPCPTGLTCPAVFNGFVYSGQAFTSQVTALNAGGLTTLNYDTAKGLSKAVTLSAWNAAGGATPNPGGGNLTLNMVPSTAFSLGVASTTTPIYTFSMTPTAPTNIFARAVDADNVTSLRGVSSVEGGMTIVSGRTKISNAHGSELLQLPISVTAQYWNGASYATSTTDSVSSFMTSSVVFSNWQKLSAASTWATGATSVVTPPTSVVFVNGVASLKLAIPGAGNTGSVDMITNAPNYLPSNTARATFGVYKGAKEFIYMRENY
jgi:MSHA biogenesis protein MshQ